MARYTDLHQNDYRSEITFPNGRGASIVCHSSSYGGRNNGELFELAVLDRNGDIDTTTPVTGFVLSWLTFREVADALDKIAALPA